MTMMMHALFPLLLLPLASAVPSPQLLDQEALDPDQVIYLTRYYLVIQLLSRYLDSI